MQEKSPRNGLEIAIIGMSGRFPGADNINKFWENLKNGINSIRFFTEKELLENTNINTDAVKQPNYIKAKGIISNVEYFDAVFFGYSPGEAELLDPQVRIFYEICWEALEDGGCDPSGYDGAIGVYAGGSANFCWEMLTVISGRQDIFGQFSSGTLSDKDYLSARIAYKLDLKGPAVTLSTACSTSLAAIDLACRGLLTGQCDAALVGGISVTAESARGGGYLYEEGFIRSSDGYVRVFDARARGVVFSHGGGAVLLKRLDDAIADRNSIYAVIKSFALNNDGLNKSSFAAPGLEGQTRCIRTALELSELDPAVVTYLEAHGTATELGDVIEMEALKTAFSTDKKQYCAIGSVKTNIGHLDVASGIAGLIKVALMLKHRQIPPSLNYETPNPNIDFKNSPFSVNTRLREWQGNGYPLRAGVSSFGIGGTNVHVLLEEAPYQEPSSAGRPYQLLLLSARTDNALEQMTKNLTEYLKLNPALNLADVAYSLKPGRKTFEHRRMLVCSTLQEAIDILQTREPVNREPSSEENIPSLQTFYGKEEKQVVFMFPGQGSQYVNMARGIYESEALFREESDRCFEILKPLIGHDIKEILYPGISPQSTQSTQSDKFYNKTSAPSAPSAVEINQTQITQPLIFVIEYALARLLISWGIVPDAMVGHSIGEYVAACLSGVFSLEDALAVVVQRGKLMQQMPPGKMLSVTLPEQELKPLLINENELDLAAVNGSSHCVVSGPPAAIDAFTRQLGKNSHQYRLLHTSHAYHSKMMGPILKPFAGAVAKVKRNAPRLPFISNLSGGWITYQEAADPGYWANHLRQTVRFAAGVSELLKDEQTIFIEVGPGRTLSTLVRQHPDKQPGHLLVNLMRHPREKAADEFYLLSKLGQVWLYGKELNWKKYYQGEKRQRLHLPAYPFQRQRCWIEGNPEMMMKKGLKKQTFPVKEPDMADWFYIPSWKRSVIFSPPNKQKKEKQQWLVFAADNKDEFVSQLVNRLAHGGESHVTVVLAGEKFSKLENKFSTLYKSYTLNPFQEEDYKSLIKELRNSRGIPTGIIHSWNLNHASQDEAKWALAVERLEETLHLGFYSLLYLAKALGKSGAPNTEPDIRLLVLTNGMQEISGEKVKYPQKAAVLGPVITIPLEYPGIKCCCIDIDIDMIYPGPPDRGKMKYKHRQEWLLKQLLKEFKAGMKNQDMMIAYRGNHRFVRYFESAPFDKPDTQAPRLKVGGVYLITGGLGGIGLVLARYLAGVVQGKLILTGRSGFPAKEQWQEWLNTYPPSDRTSQKINKLKELEALGAEVRIYSIDVSDQGEMQKLAAEVKEEWGTLHGVIHAAGVPGSGLSYLKNHEIADKVLSPKIKGTVVLHHALQRLGIAPDFMMLCSSISSVIPFVGLLDYAAANAFMDAFAFYSNTVNQPGVFTVSINWDIWQEVGMATEALNKPKEKKNAAGDFDMDSHQQEHLKNGITPPEGIEAFTRILSQEERQVLLSTTDLDARLGIIMNFKTEDLVEGIPGASIGGTAHPRPDISTSYAPPVTRLEQKLATIWQMILKVKQVGINDDFFELGGDSLKATVMIATIHKELNVKISLEQIFQTPHIKGLSRYIRGKKQESYASIEPVEKKEYHVLSSPQKRLYILQQMDPLSTAYNIVQVIPMEMEEEQDIEKLAGTLKKLLHRHESLRTSFHIVEDQPVQRIHDEVEFEIEYYNSGKQGNREIGNKRFPASLSPSLPEFTKNFIHPFDLSLAPLLRVGLLPAPCPLPPASSLLIVDMHHIISDGVSHRILAGDFSALSEGNELPPLRIQYKDFAHWQNSREEKERIKHQEAYWLKEFANQIPVLNLPLDYPRPSTWSFAGNTVSFEISAEYTHRLKTIASKENATLYMVTLALFNILLSKLGSQEDIIIGTPVAGRSHADLHHIMGMFANTLVLRNYPSGKKTFTRFLAEVKKRTLEAFENQEYQFEDLVDNVITNRDTGRNPIFDVMFALQQVDSPVTGGKEREYQAQNNTAAFDMFLQGIEKNLRIIFTLDYCTNLFKEETIKRFIDYFKEVISCVLDHVDTRLEDIKISHDLLAANPYNPGIEFGF